MDIYTDVIHLEPSDIETNDGKMRISGMNGNGLVVVYAPWCHFCQDLKPIWKNVAKSNRNKFFAVNSTDDKGGQNVARMLGANGFPTILVVKGGEIKGKYSGNRIESELLAASQ